MTSYVAFLRAINVGGRNAKMDHLRGLFESLGFSRVETFIASGNLRFESPSKNPQALAKKIENCLHKALGYEVATFIRTEAELAAIACYRPFRQAVLDEVVTLNIAFLADEPDDKSRRTLMALRTDIDDFHVHGREVYWACRKKQSESTFSNVVLEKALGVRSTIRGVKTVQRMTGRTFDER